LGRVLAPDDDHERPPQPDDPHCSGGSGIVWGGLALKEQYVSSLQILFALGSFVLVFSAAILLALRASSISPMSALAPSRAGRVPSSTRQHEHGAIRSCDNIAAIHSHI
jgi:hypothetical protein